MATQKKQKNLTKRDVIKCVNQIYTIIKAHDHLEKININVVFGIKELSTTTLQKLTDALHEKIGPNQLDIYSDMIHLVNHTGNLLQEIDIHFVFAEDLITLGSPKIHGFSQEIQGTAFVKLTDEEIDRIAYSPKKTLTSWVNECLTKCVRERYTFAIIVIPPGLVMSDIAGEYKENGVFTTAVYDQCIELCNESKGYMISIMTAHELGNLISNGSGNVDICFTHHLHDPNVSEWAKRISTSEPEAVPDNPVSDETDYSELNKKILDIKDEFMKEPAAIPDSGNEPRVFDSGFKRDSDIGKAKWSLLPPFTWKLLLPGVGEPISFFLLTGKVKELEAALNGLVQEHGVDHMCARYHGGAEKYGYFNWAQLGPLSNYLDSLGRHLWAISKWGVKENDPETKSDHIGAAMWNLSCAIHVVTLAQGGHADSGIIDIPAYLNLVR